MIGDGKWEHGNQVLAGKVLGGKAGKREEERGGGMKKRIDKER